MLLLASLLYLVPAGADTPDIPRLIQQLGSPEFSEREAASKRLEDIGAPALDALRKAARDSDDPEIRSRASRILTALTQHDQDQLQGTWDCSLDEATRLVFAKDHVTFARDIATTFTYRLSTVGNLRAIDFLNRGQVVLAGIYVLKGDELELCLPILYETRRPEALAPAGARDAVTVTFKRRPASP
jgi:hypothetical protein